MTAAAAGESSGLGEFIAGLPRASWFASLGQPATASEIDEVALLSAGLDYPDIELNWVADWSAADAAARQGDTGWWDREEAMRRSLLARLGPGALVQPALDRVMRVSSDVVHGAAAVAANRAGLADPYLTRVAAGAASQAAYQAALALAAGEGAGHPFAAKYRLFAAGRWPLGRAGGRLCIF